MTEKVVTLLKDLPVFGKSRGDSDKVSPSIAAPEQWDLIIRPKTAWFDLHLSDLWRYRDLTLLFVWRDFVAQYKQTILGPLWHLIQPLFTTALFTLVFGRVARLSTDALPPILFYMAGVTCWNYFAECLNRTSATFIQNAAIFGKVYFPRLSVPVSVVLSNIIKFIIQFALFLVFVGYYYSQGAAIRPNIYMLLMPLLLLIMAALGLGLGIIVSALTTKYRDLQVLVAFGVQLLMFVTPVIYPVSMVSQQYRWLILANPMSAVVETFRYAFLGAGTVDLCQLMYSAGVTLVILCIGVLLFNRVERTFMDTV
jgi:lipopolysaccharide transport system permease protein